MCYTVVAFSLHGSDPILTQPFFSESLKRGKVRIRPQIWYFDLLDRLLKQPAYWCILAKGKENKAQSNATENISSSSLSLHLQHAAAAATTSIPLPLFYPNGGSAPANSTLADQIRSESDGRIVLWGREEEKREWSGGEKGGGE